MTSAELVLIDTLMSNQQQNSSLLRRSLLPQTETKGIYFQTSATKLLVKYFFPSLTELDKLFMKSKY